jgi:uncharacterized protein (TIGR02996 family)
MSRREEEEKAAFEEALAENPYDEATHKVFADWLEEHGFDDEALLHREWTPEKMRAAESWLENFAVECAEVEWQPLTYDKLIAAAHDYLDTGNWLCLSDDTPDIALSNEGMESFWQHFMVVTGRPVPSDKLEARFIHCSC